MRSFGTKILFTVLAIQFCLAASSFAQPPTVGQNFASLVYLDGKNVVENAHFHLQQDQFLSFETYDLQPNSSVELTTQQNGLPLVKKVYQTNANGAMKDILFFPKAKSNIRCVVRFITQNGQEKRLVFHLKPV